SRKGRRASKFRPAFPDPVRTHEPPLAWTPRPDRSLLSAAALARIDEHPVAPPQRSGHQVDHVGAENEQRMNRYRPPPADIRGGKANVDDIHRSSPADPAADRLGREEKIVMDIV